MTSAWRCFRDELALWRDIGRNVDFWWRDDDATAPTAALLRLVALSHSSQAPLALAVIPADAQLALLDGLPATVTLLQHGLAHRNGAPAGEKKTEFPAGLPVDDALERLRSGWQRLAHHFGTRAMAVLVPPWNRISTPDLVAHLPGAGYVGLSRFGARAAACNASGLQQVNTHVDVIDWRGSRGFAGEDAVLRQAVHHLQARRTGAADGAEPTGWLTHHAVHDAATWAFLQQLLYTTTELPHVRWRGAPELFVPS